MLTVFVDPAPSGGQKEIIAATVYQRQRCQLHHIHQLAGFDHAASRVVRIERIPRSALTQRARRRVLGRHGDLDKLRSGDAIRNKLLISTPELRPKTPDRPPKNSATPPKNS